MRLVRLACWALLPAVFLAAGARRADAQTGKITGVVVDAQTGQALPGVQIQLVGTGRGAVTSSSGRYFILSVPPGQYTLTARRIGYQQITRPGVQMLIDVTREENFRLQESSSQLAAVRVEIAREPLILPGQTGSETAITASEIQALPTTNIAGVLGLQLGYLGVPVENTDVTAYNDDRRNVNVVRVRGGRAAETLTLIDGIPVNNFLFGGPAIGNGDLSGDVAEQINFQRGGFEAQYGNAMSGIINIATREGGTRTTGSVLYQTSRAAGALGSGADEARGSDIVQGNLGGALPLTGDRVRWFVAGRQNTNNGRALEFDDRIYDPFFNRADVRGNSAQAVDFFRGWRGMGFKAQRDLFAKVTTYFTPSTKLNTGYFTFQNQAQGYNPFFVLSGYDVVEACASAYPSQRDFCERNYGFGRVSRAEDVLNSNTTSRQAQKYTIQGSTRVNRNLAWASLNTTQGRTNVQVRAGRLHAAREACNFLTGVCLGDKIRNYTTAQTFAIGRFITPSTRPNTPYTNPGAGSENFAGGDTNTTYSLRADLQSQVTDHHNIQAGVFGQRHDLRFYEARNVTRPFDESRIANYVYGGKPWDASVYLQDRIEFDFLTIKLGVRYDYTRADGEFFRNPLDPTNGTTARDVCEGRAFGGTPYTLPGVDGVTGIAACSASPALLDSATRLASGDDFGKAPIRKQFSPRVGVQFPISTRSSFFANWGIYSQNPTYHSMYNGTGIGRTADTAIVDRRRLARNSVRVISNGGLDTSFVIPRGSSLQGTPFGPNFRQDPGNIVLLGNPSLAIERTSAYELGFQSEVGRNFAVQLTAYAKDQSGLAGVRRGGITTTGTNLLDEGQTYNPTGTGLNYFVVVNTDYQTVRGAEVILRRKLADFWAFTLNYGYQQCFANAAPPELEIQKLIEGDVAVAKEVRCEVDQPHVFNGTLRFEFDQRVPEFRYSRLLRDSRLTLTTSAASGLPYTPSLTFTGAVADRLERNSGTSPTTWTVNLRADKAFRVGNLRYGAYLVVDNLLDRRNCLQPYPTTGQCNSGTLSTFRSFAGAFQNGGGADPGIGSINATTTQFDQPQLMGERRAISTGLRVAF